MTRSYAGADEMNMPFHGAKLALLAGRHVVTLLRDADPCLAYAGCWDLPGGGREGGEDPLACALRETYEELGVRVSPDAVVWGRRFVTGAGASWFFAARISDSLLNEIVFGHEGQGWATMKAALFLEHPRTIPNFRDRLRMCLETLPLMEKPPAVLSGGR